MWLLFLVLTVMEGDLAHISITHLKSYTTQEQCEKEKSRITKEMQQSYPGETDYTLVCDKKMESL